jgi:hypothetical protein
MPIVYAFCRTAASVRFIAFATSTTGVLKTLSGLTPYEFICKAWTSQPQRFTISPLQKMPGLNS